VNIVILGAGVQGTVFAVRLAAAGHQVTLIAHPERAAELRQRGAAIQNLNSMQISAVPLPVLESLPPNCDADLCLVTVRREQLDSSVADLVRAPAIKRIVLLVNHATGSAHLKKLLGSPRTVLAFPGIAGDRQGNLIRYLDIPQQRTVVEKQAPDVASLLQHAGFPVDTVRDMDAWLQRHAVFITAIAGALYQNACDASRLANNPAMIRRFILAVRQGWAVQDRRQVAPAPFALRSIICWVPLSFSTRYWRRLLASPHGDIYFSLHVQHASAEMAALAEDLRSCFSTSEAPELQSLLAFIDAWQPSTSS
jgi:2-dehydropantoate 2-reductase